MTVAIQTISAEKSDLRAILGAAILGFAILLTTGFAYPAAMHDAAHDTRHVVGFPCH